MIGIDHGVEYHVEFDPNSINYFDIAIEYMSLYKTVVVWNSGVIVIASTRKTDDRLIKSNYYKNRKDTWFDDLHEHDKTLIENIDMSLDDQEKEYLDFVLSKFGTSVKRHGWFDVVHIK